MKKLALLTGILMMLFVTSCRDIVNSVLDALPPFTVPFTTNVQVPLAAVSTTDYTRTPQIPMNINLDAKIKEQNPNFSINNLKHVGLKTFKIDYVSSQLGNQLDVIKNARIYIKAPNKPEFLIASAMNNTNPTSIVFNTVNDNILEYFRTAENSLIFEIQGNEVTADQITMKISSEFEVKVQL